jgi:NTE family protein
MRCLSQWIANRIFKQMIGVSLSRVPVEAATSPDPSEYWPPLPFMPRGLAERLVGRWINLLDTGPLRQTLLHRLKIDEKRLASSEKTLLITATNVKTGERVIFSNQPIIGRVTGEPRRDIIHGININRILASCSIPLVYPWTYDIETDAYYWDGAVVANTPLGAALDAVREQPLEIPMEVVVVLMTPWWEKGQAPPKRAQELPASFGQAITWTLDWALLASFRERMRLTQVYNEFARQERMEGKESLRYRDVNVLIVAPQDFFPVERIIDYDIYSKELIRQGYEATERAFKEEFAGNLSLVNSNQ